MNLEALLYKILQYLQIGQRRLNYTPVNDLDYGSISCWGTNDVGKQHEPCVFQVVIAGKLIDN